MNRANILVVDDSEASRYVLVRFLQSAGFAVREAGGGVEALRLLTAGPADFDLVILDVNLPDIDGLAVSRELREHADLQHLPVLMASAYRLTSEDYVAGLDEGADAYLTHPIEPDVLIATVRALLRIRAAEAQIRQLNAALAARTRELHELNHELEARVAQRTRELEVSRAQLAYTAHHDILTGLRNRAAFQHEIQRLMSRSPADGDSRNFAVMIVDLDGLKLVNDTGGHERGDALLRAFGEALSQAFRAEDRVYRLGGDEYALLLDGADSGTAHALKAKVHRAITDTVGAGFHECAASAGVAFFPQEGLEWNDLVRLADQRMYEEKEDHRAARRQALAEPGS